MKPPSPLTGSTMIAATLLGCTVLTNAFSMDAKQSPTQPPEQSLPAGQRYA
jgi:hypothetical protein